MSDLDLGKLCAHVQNVARFHGAYRGRLPQIVALVLRSMKSKLDADLEIERTLQKPGVQTLLAAKYEVALWRGKDGNYRLVSLALPSTAAAAAERASFRPLDLQNQCAFCMLGEKASHFELRPDLDVRGEQPIPGLSFHRQCLPAWRALRMLAAKDMNHV